MLVQFRPTVEHGNGCEWWIEIQCNDGRRLHFTKAFRPASVPQIGAEYRSAGNHFRLARPISAVLYLDQVNTIAIVLGVQWVDCPSAVVVAEMELREWELASEGANDAAGLDVVC